jgi:S1-C subfamily serine protease
MTTRPLAAVVLAAALTRLAAAEIPSTLVNGLKPTVVNIEVSVQHGLNSEAPGKHKGTGFIVDGKRGIIATNRHVVGTSPGPIKIVFENGQTAQARRWHYDSWHDFAFIRLEPVDKTWDLPQVRFGDSRQLKEQDDVVMIGNNDVQ